MHAQTNAEFPRLAAMNQARSVAALADVVRIPRLPGEAADGPAHVAAIGLLIQFIHAWCNQPIEDQPT